MYGSSVMGDLRTFFMVPSSEIIKYLLGGIKHKIWFLVNYEILRVACLNLLK
jgi:hypothetical protein